MAKRTSTASTTTPLTPETSAPGGINAALGAQLQTLLGQRSPTTIPSGFFAWWGNIAFPDGATNTPVVTQQDWLHYYQRIQQAAISPSIIAPYVEVLQTTNEYRPDGPIPVAIASFQLNVPQPAFMSQVNDAAANGTALDPAPANLPSVIQPAQAFFVAGLMHEQWGQIIPQFRSRVVTYVIDERFYCTNPGAPLPDAIEFDPNDGKGPRTVKFGSRVTASYPQGASATATVRCHYGATVLEGKLSIPILETDAAPLPDETWPLVGIPSLNGGTAYVYRAPGHPKVTNAIVVSEGFPGGYTYDYLYDMMNQQGTLEKLRTAGYDVILLSYANGTDEMQRNADVVIACIRQVMSLTQTPMIVGGVSMGGLITRFALASLEARQFPHNTRLYFTIDTPHGAGAYTCIADQWLAHYLASSSPEAAAMAELVDTTSNQQFMMWWVNGDTVVESPLRTEFLRELAGVGNYPQLPRRIAVSCGRGDGQRSLAPSTPILSWSGWPFASASLSTMGEGSAPAVVGQAYSFLADPSTPTSLSFTTPVSWEGGPGGQNDFNVVAADIIDSVGSGTIVDKAAMSCCIPTLSALDIDPAKYSPFAPVPAPSSGASPFHDYTCSPENVPHLTLTPEVSAWLISQFGTAGAMQAPAHARRSTPIRPEVGDVTEKRFDPASFDPHDPDFITNPYPTYAKFREQAPIHYVEPYGSYWAFRYEDCMRILNDSDNFGPMDPKTPPGVNDFLKNRYTPPPEPPAAPFDVLANFPEGLFFLDPLEHGIVRNMMEPLFQASIADATVIATIAARPQLLAAKAAGMVDLYTAYALPMPAAVMMTVLGVPQQDWMGVGAWVQADLVAHDITQPASVQAAGATSVMALMTYLNALTYPGGVITPSKGRLIDRMQGLIGPEPEKMSAMRANATTVNLIIAGYLSTTFLIATGTYNLLRYNQLDLLRKNPSLMNNAINEMLRFDGPVQVVDRYVAKKDVTLGGRRFIAGDLVTAVLGSGDHDAAAFSNPDSFDITRKFDPKTPHFGFGWGIHTCFGAPLVMEHTAPAAFKMMLDELPSIKLAGTPQWQTDPYLRSVSNLPLDLRS